MARRKEKGTNRGEKARVSWERNLGRDEVVIGDEEKIPRDFGRGWEERGRWSFSRIAVLASINWN